MSGGCNDSVILFKALSESENEGDDAFCNAFRAAGFQVTLIPVLDFEFVNLDEFLIKLKNPDNYEGIIFTSPRCVTAVELAISCGNESTLLEKWEKHKHFAVGRKTAQMVEKLKFIADGKESGDGKKLAEIICRGQYEKPFLYPKGSLTKDGFKTALTDHHVQVDESLVYRTKPHPGLEKNIEAMKVLISVKSVYFVYFSPSGVNFTFPFLQKYQFEVDKVKFIAIGPTTEAALKENGLNVAAVAVKPEPQSVLDAVLISKIQG